MQTLVVPLGLLALEFALFSCQVPFKEAVKHFPVNRVTFSSWSVLEVPVSEGECMQREELCTHRFSKGKRKSNWEGFSGPLLHF